MGACRRIMVALGLSAAALAFVPAPAFACTPPVGGLPRYTISEHVRAAPIALEGVVTAVSSQDYSEAAAIQVVQYLKGSGPAAIAAQGFGPGSQCLSEVSVGQHALFYLTDSGTGYFAYYLSQFDAVAPADPASLAEAEAAS